MNKNAEYQSKWRKAHSHEARARVKQTRPKVVERKLRMVEDALAAQKCYRCHKRDDLLFVDANDRRAPLRKMAHATASDARLQDAIAAAKVMCQGCYKGKNGANNRRKEDVLGMPFGTACGRLRKNVLFDLVQKTGLSSCFRCGELIASADDLTLEHKRPWLTNASLFWDLDNIAFSHARCNVPHVRLEKNPTGST